MSQQSDSAGKPIAIIGIDAGVLQHFAQGSALIVSATAARARDRMGGALGGQDRSFRSEAPQSPARTVLSVRMGETP